MACFRSSVLLLIVCVCINADDLTEADKQEVLDVHNIWRRNVEPSASNMIKLQWSNVLANGTNTWVNECKNGNNRFLNKDESDMKDMFKRLGQNHWAGFEEVWDMKNVVNSWGVEVVNYSYEKRRCVSESGSAPNCGHYTQVVRATTEFIGCAKKECSINIDGEDTFIYRMTCFYGPGGNSFFTSPYKKGTPCTKCRKGYICDNKLCVDPNPEERELTESDVLKML